MVPAGERLKEILESVVVSPLTIPVVSNAEAAPNAEASRVKDLLVAQVSAPVRWEESVRIMVGLGVKRFIEIGPGKVLAGLVKRIDKGVEAQSVSDVAGLKSLHG
jgi:[acyl-carrier-protein] S-malonyltransferase